MSVVSQERRAQGFLVPVLMAVAAGSIVALLAGNQPPIITVAAIGLLLFLALFLGRPDLGLLLVLLVRASSDLSITLGQVVGQGIPLAGWSNIALISVVVVAGGILILAQGMPFLSLPAGRLLGLLLLIGLLAAYRSESTLLSFSDWVPVLAGFVVYALAAHLFRTPRAMQRVLDVLAASFLLPAALGFYQLIQGEGVIVPGLTRARIVGTFVHPNPLGFYLVILLAVFMIQFLSQTGRRRAVAFLGAGAASVLLIATFTRVAWVGALIVVFVVALCRARVLLIAVPLIGILAVGFIPPVAERLADPLGGSLADRFTELWPATIGEWIRVTAAEPTVPLVAVSRLVGLGPGMGLILTQRGGYFFSTPPHNDYLRILVEYGIFGLFMFVLVLAVLAVFAYQTWRLAQGSDSFLAGVALIFLALSVAFPVMGFTDNVFGYTANQVYFWTLAGLSVAVRRLAEKSPGRGIASSGHLTVPARAGP